MIDKNRIFMDINELLEDVIDIIKRTKEEKEPDENINIFNILGVGEDELTHSKIIETLLNHTAEPEKEKVFLKLFIEEIKKEIKKQNIEYFEIDEINICSNNAVLSREEFVTNEDENGKIIERGRVDIVIKSNKNNKKKIYIENKINAKDQEKQLFKYYYSSAERPILIYLTKYGSYASIKSLNGEDIPYIIFSYKENILVWLMVCKKRIEEDCCEENKEINEILLRIINQYIYIVKQITRQTRRDIMIEKLIMEKLDIEDYDTIISTISYLDNIKKVIVDNKLLNLKKSILKDKLKEILVQLYEKKIYDYTDVIKKDISNLSEDKYYEFIAKNDGLLLYNNNWCDVSIKLHIPTKNEGPVYCRLWCLKRGKDANNKKEIEATCEDCRKQNNDKPICTHICKNFDFKNNLFYDDNIQIYDDVNKFYKEFKDNNIENFKEVFEERIKSLGNMIKEYYESSSVIRD